MYRRVFECGTALECALPRAVQRPGPHTEYSEKALGVAVVEFPDGKLAAFFRDGAGTRKIQRSESRDGGLTWSEVASTDLPNPGAGIEAVLLRNGHLAMIYNPLIKSPRDKLAISISEDAGKTWKWTRLIEDQPGGRFDYPSLIQAADGTLHATYSFNLKTIKHVQFNESWVHVGR